jgi:broad specificity phosphatase PhoE
VAESNANFKSTASLTDSERASKGNCCRRIKDALGIKTVEKFHQTLVVLRHSERQDRMDPTYHSTPAGKEWPHDTPITEAGVKLATTVANEIQLLNEKAKFVAIACSPYRRCLETAAPVAKLLNVPVVIDQELGEVFDDTMPNPAKERSPFRSPTELADFADSLGMRLMNPELDDGGVKLFGKPPIWPETLEDAKKRFVVRIETYIEQSAQTRQNFVLVTHADAVAAALELFERGYADIQNMDFCARLVAERSLKGISAVEEQHGTYAEKWDVKFQGISAEVCEGNKETDKYFEKLHVEQCDEVEKVAAARRKKRTQTDAVFDSTLGGIKRGGPKKPVGMAATVAKLRSEGTLNDLSDASRSETTASPEEPHERLPGRVGFAVE